MSERVTFHIQKGQKLRTDRGNWDTQWEEAASFVMPSHRNSFTGRGLDNAITGGGQKKTEIQFDSTASIANQRFASVIESLTTPQASVWHRLVPADKMLKRNRAVRMFFDDLNEQLFNQRYRPDGNFVGNSQQCYMGIGAYGNGQLFVDKPEDGKGLRYRNFHLGEVYFVENHAGVIDSFYRYFQRNARQLMQEKWDNLPEAVTEAAKNPLTAEKNFEILHCVYPREDYDPRRVDPKGMKFASLYIFVQSKELMRESGYQSFPMPTARYTQAPGEVYGRGPAQLVLAAIKVLNEQAKTMLKQGHRVVDPVLLAHDDGNLGSFSMKPGFLNPGGVNADGRPLVHVLPTGNIAVGDKIMEMGKVDIRSAFLIDLFQILVDSPQMTATEVLERAREKGMLLAPIAGRIHSEFLGRLIERELDLMFQQGLVPSIPSILQDEEAAQYHIEYDNPMSRMARAEKAAGFMRALDTAANYAKMTGDLRPLDWFKFDSAIPALQDIQGAPVEWTSTQEEVDAMRAERAQQAQTQQMVDAAPAAASVVKTVAK